MIPRIDSKMSASSHRLGQGHKPSWLKVKLPSHHNFFFVSDTLRKHKLNTICRSARCPNISECWSEKTATFLILGNTCTRDCAFCAVIKGIPLPPSPEEPSQVARAVSELGLRYAVITSVTRDDLSDGGASFFAETVRMVKKTSPGTNVEVLTPDFGGNERALDRVLDTAPAIFNHNLETTEALYSHINRPKTHYRRSLAVLLAAKKKGATTKSGLMVGLGEDMGEIIQTLSDLRHVSCDLLTIGQYLQPTRTSVPVRKYYSPREFEQIRHVALDLGFLDTEAGPLVRSSFHAHRMHRNLQNLPESEPCVI